MDFARKQLEKYGWTDGKGLGKHEDGISQALKPKLKRSVTGVGHDPASDFNEHWWSALYDKAAKNVEVENKNGKTKKIKTNNDDFVISSSTWKMNHKNTDNKAQYSEHFVRTSVLTNDQSGRRTENVREGTSEIEDIPDINVVKMTDEELFAACGGRTAHKGARHGLKALGKLARIAQQEQMLLVQPQYEGYSHAKKLKQAVEHNNEEQVAKTKKKKKKVLENGFTEVVESNKDVLLEMDRVSSLNKEDCVEPGSDKIKSKRKKKNKKALANGKSEMVESNIALPEKYTVARGVDRNHSKNASGTEKVVSKSKKNKNKCSNNDNTESNDDALPEDMIRDMLRETDEDCEEIAKSSEIITPTRKKKKKCLENGNAEISSNTMSEIIDKKKSKKKEVLVQKM